MKVFSRNSIGLVLVGGMMIGTIFTLFVLPSIYVLLAKDHQMHQPASVSRTEKAEET